LEPKVPERGVGSEQPAVTVVYLSDPAIAGQGIGFIDLDAVQLARRRPHLRDRRKPDAAEREAAPGRHSP